MKRCEVCATNDGMVPNQSDGSIVWCDHGALAASIAAAELRDRIIADRRRRATGATQ